MHRLTHTLLFLTTLVLARPALAEGLCERTTDTFGVLAYSKTAKAVAIERAFEVCTEDDSGGELKEVRRTHEFVEILDAGGTANRWFAGGDDAARAAFVDWKGMDEEAVAPRAALDAYLKEGGFKPVKPSLRSGNKRCTAKLTAEGPVDDYTVTLVVTAGKDRVLTETFDGQGNRRYTIEVWFLSEAQLLVIRAVMPELVGARGPGVVPDQSESQELRLLQLGDHSELARCF